VSDFGRWNHCFGLAVSLTALRFIAGTLIIRLYEIAPELLAVLGVPPGSAPVCNCRRLSAPLFAYLYCPRRASRRGINLIQLISVSRLSRIIFAAIAQRTAIILIRRRHLARCHHWCAPIKITVSSYFAFQIYFRRTVGGALSPAGQINIGRA